MIRGCKNHLIHMNSSTFTMVNKISTGEISFEVENFQEDKCVGIRLAPSKDKPIPKFSRGHDF